MNDILRCKENKEERMEVGEVRGEIYAINKY